MFNSLQIYTVHVKPGHKAWQENPIFVREGFNFWGFIFTFFWSLYNRLWLVSAIMLASNLLVVAAKNSETITEGSALALMMAMQVIIGFHGNDWLRAKLKKRGFITAGIVTGDSRLRAEQRFFEQLVATPQASPAT